MHADDAIRERFPHAEIVPDLDGLEEFRTWWGICDECHQHKGFPTERQAQLWEQHHPHQETHA